MNPAAPKRNAAPVPVVPFDNRSLFSDHYLNDRLRGLPEWTADVTKPLTALRALYEQERKGLESLTESQLEDQWIKPILRDVLGWSYVVQPQHVGMGGQTKRPDYSLFTDPERKQAAQAATGDEQAFYGHAAAIAEAKYWNRPLDREVRKEVRDITQTNPSFQIVFYLFETGVQWGVLTNGREWRLYSGRARSRVDTYYAVDLERILKGGDEDAFRYFYLFFRAAAFRADPSTGRSFVQSVLEGTVSYARELERKLKGLVFDEIFPHLARGLVAWRRENNGVETEAEESLREIYEGTLRLLYRLLFLLHAEARGLLPTGEYSLTRIKQDVATFIDAGKTLSPVSDNFWNDLAGLFRRVDRGDPATGMPRYNGGLFRADAPRNRFLREHRVADAFLAPALDLLARAGGKEFIDYKALNVEQLGSLYEGLLEFRLRLNDKGEPFLENDKGERKATGSYYTPHYIVEYIVTETVGKVLEERAARFRGLMEEIQGKEGQLRRSRSEDGKHRLRLEVESLGAEAVDALLGIRICDPAMGSGHFLVHATNWLTEKLMVVLNEYPENPVLARIAEIRAQIVESLREQGITIDPETLKDTSLLKRMVMKQCIYGVDLNPMATELAKLSLWLDSFTVGAPLSFLDHHLKTGNSLVGTTVPRVQEEYEEDRHGQLNLGAGPFAGIMEAAVLMRDVAGRTDATATEVAQSASLYTAYEEAVIPFKRVLDLWTSQHFGNFRGAEFVRFFGDGAVRMALMEPEKHKPRFRDAVLVARQLAQDRHFFHWDLEFPEVFVDLDRANWKENPGFDAVIGNPPYVRQEQVTAVKPYLKSAYADVYDGAADLYVYFYREGMQLLREGGRLSYIVTNKWLKAGYGAGLRDYFAGSGEVEQIVDFGHAPIFPDADVFPCIVVVRKGAVSADSLASAEARICIVPREALHGIDLGGYVRRHGFGVPMARFQVRAQQARDNLAEAPAPAWSLEVPEVEALMEKIRSTGLRLREFIRATPYRGILTGLNEAFLIDTATRDALVREDRKCEELLRPFLRGQDVDRWVPSWDGLWMIVLKSSENQLWPWTDAPKELAERIFKQTYPSLYKHFKPLAPNLRKRQDQGRYWWELRSCAYYEAFERPKIFYADIAWSSQFALDPGTRYCNNTMYFLPTGSLWVLTVLNSPLMWYYISRRAVHGKDDALRLFRDFVEFLPIAVPTDAIQTNADVVATRLIELTREQRDLSAEFLNWVRTEFAVRAPSEKLERFATLDSDEFIAEVRSRRGRSADTLTPRQLKALRDTHAEYAAGVNTSAAQAGGLERELSDLVNQAYGLTPEEVDLMWKTAPPRMPMGR